MNSLLDDDDDPSDKDHELTLSTGSILGIFLGLVLLCGLFFGFGYKMGSRKSPPPIVASAPQKTSAPSANFSSFKPAAGEPANSSPAPTAPAPEHEVHPVADTDSSTSTSPVRAAPPSTSTTPAAAPAAPAANGIFVVQVAAVSRQEDAELLVHALTVKGYPAFQRNEPQDKLLHIQVGPFTSRKEADAARQRLLGDGYQPIIK
jgi:DedD protein